MLHEIGTAVGFCSEISQSGAKGSPCPALLLVFQGILQRGNHGTHGAQGGESTPQRHHPGDRAGEEPPARLTLSCEKVPVQTGAHSSLQQVEQCLADPSIPGERGGGPGGDSAQRSKELS